MLTRIRDVRRAKRWTLAEVAARCDPATTAQTIGRLETGMRTVSVDWLNRIARALDVEPSELVTLPERVDIPVAAVWTAGQASAPPRQMSLLPPGSEPTMVGLAFDSPVGDYRAGDQLWLERLTPDRFGQALNRDALAPRPIGRFAFGRLVSLGGDHHIAPHRAGAAPVAVADSAWIGVARMLIRPLE